MELLEIPKCNLKSISAHSVSSHLSGIRCLSSAKSPNCLSSKRSSRLSSVDRPFHKPRLTIPVVKDYVGVCMCICVYVCVNATCILSLKLCTFCDVKRADLCKNMLFGETSLVKAQSLYAYYNAVLIHRINYLDV